MNTTPEERQQILHLSLKSLINSFPVVGPLITDVLLEFRSKVRQERINHFVGLLETAFCKMGIDSDTLKTEENLDLFEGIFKKVAQSRNAQKRIGFKNILVHGIKDSSEIEYCEIFSELLLSIHNKELEILIEHQHYLINGNGLLKIRAELKSKLDNTQELIDHGFSETIAPELSPFMSRLPGKTQDDIKREIETATRLLNTYKSNCTAEKFGITEDEYKYFLQDLLSKGLLSDDGVGSIGTRAIEIMSLTKFGVKFLSFVQLA